MVHGLFEVFDVLSLESFNATVQSPLIFFNVPVEKVFEAGDELVNVFSSVSCATF